MIALGLARASSILDAAIADARRRNLAPLAVAVLDAGGHLIAFKREDGAGIVRFDIAFGKEWGALGMGFGTRELAQRAAKAPTFVTALDSALDEVRGFCPDVLAISAGFDAYKDDPITQMDLEIETFGEIGGRIAALQLPSFAVLEGGYSRDFGRCVAAFVTAWGRH